MNKKFRSFLTLTVMILVTILLTSCFEGAPETFEIVSLPKTSYVLNEEFDWDGLKVKLNGVNHVIDEVNDLTSIGIAVYPAVLSTASEGIKSVTLSYGSLTATFQYTVYKTIFAGGDGSKENPYQISTVEQFYQITFNKNVETNSFEDNYFEIINDIDFTNHTLIWVDYKQVIENIHIDGNNYTFRNLSSILFTNILSNKKNGTTIENLNLDYKSGGFGITSFVEPKGEGEVTFKNINAYGQAILSPASQNAGAFIGHIYGDSQSPNDSVYFIDCDNHMDMVGESQRAGVFIGGMSINTNVYFQNCKNYATLEGDNMGFLVGNNSNYLTSTFYIDEQTVNFATIVASTNASDFCAGDNTKVLLSDAPNVRVLLSDGTSVPYNEYTGTWEINKGELIEVSAAGMTLSKDATSSRLAMTLSTDARVAKYKLFVTYWGNTYHDVERQNLIGTNTVALYQSGVFTTVEQFNALPINFAYKWINTAGTYMNVVDNKYIFTDADVPLFVTKELALGVTYLLYAYDAEGNILGVKKITA